MTMALTLNQGRLLLLMVVFIGPVHARNLQLLSAISYDTEPMNLNKDRYAVFMRCPNAHISNYPFYLKCRINITEVMLTHCNHSRDNVRKQGYLHVHEIVDHDNHNRRSHRNRQCRLRLNSTSSRRKSDCFAMKRSDDGNIAYVGFAYGPSLAEYKTTTMTRCSVRCTEASNEKPLVSFNGCNTTFQKATSVSTGPAQLGAYDLKMECPGTNIQVVPFYLWCHINVTRMVESHCECDLDRYNQYIVVEDRLTHSTPNRIPFDPRVCRIRTNPIYCGKLKDECEYVERVDQHVVKVGFRYEAFHSIFGTMLTHCSASCAFDRKQRQAQRTSPNACKTTYLLRSYRDEEFLQKNDTQDWVSMHCPPFVNQLPLTLTCKFNVTKMTSVWWCNKNVWTAIEYTKVLGNINTGSVCQLTKNRTCLNTYYMCQSCTWEGDIASMSFQISKEMAMEVGIVTRTCTVHECDNHGPYQMDKHESRCRIFFPPWD